MDIDTEAWIISTKCQFAKWLAQEARAMDTAEELIRRECGVWDELQAIPSYCERFASPLLVNEQGEELHTAARPFCRDMWHSCHLNSALWQAYIYQPWRDGIMTLGAAAALFSGRQV